ncbi:MAG: GNAT family protein [Planctomycetota bacterium]
MLEPVEHTLHDGTTVNLRTPTPDDAETVLGYLDAVRRESDGIMFAPEDDLPTLDWERDWIRQRRENPHNCMVGAWSGGVLVGLANLGGGAGLSRGRHRGDLGISLRRSWWGRGLGRALMDVLLGFARDDGAIHVVRLGVYAYNRRAIALYERCGFVREGVRRWSVRFADGTYGDEVVMSRWVGPGTPPAVRDHDPRLTVSA